MENLSGKPVRPAPESGKAERPLKEEEYCGLTSGEPCHEAGLIDAGKKLCGMCGNKAAIKGVWDCTRLIPQPSYERYDGLSYYPCPAPEADCPGFLKKPSVIRAPQPKKKGLPLPEGMKFIYIGAPRGKTKKGVPQHQGVVTVAWISPAPGVLHLGFSFCSPKDRWCKVTGRDMALPRLIHPLVIPFLYDAQRTVHEVVRAVLSHDFVRLAALSPGATMWRLVPPWTKGLAKRMRAKARVAKLVAAMKRPRFTHAAGAFAFMDPFFNPPRQEGKSLAEKILSHPWQSGPDKMCFMNEAAAVSPEAWDKLTKNVRRRFIGAPPIGHSLAILARMMADIANLEK